MVDFFKNKDQQYVIDVNASIENLVNPKFLLMYIANLGLRCDVDIITDELMEEYMQLKEFTNIMNLQRTHANILYLAKFGEMLYFDYEYAWCMDECVEFAKTHHNILLNQLAFLNSIPLYLLTRLGATDTEEFGPLKDQLITTQTDKQFDEIGYSVVKLFTIKDFLMAYLHANIPLSDQIYYTRYFDDYMFNGSNIFTYVFNEKNAYAGLFQLIVETETDDESKKRLELLLDQMTPII